MTRALVASLVVALSGCSGERPGEDAAHAPMLQEIEARVPAGDGVTLAGTLTRPPLPAGARPPVVLLVGGSGPQDRDGTRAELPGYRPFRDLAAALGAAGIAVLRLDDRGTGASSGRFAGATTIDFAADAGAALGWLRARPDVDGARPALLGHSEGATIALLAASRDTTVAALVLLGAPSRTGRELARWQREALVAADGAEFPPAGRRALLARAEAEAERLATEDAWMRVWFALDPRAIARGTRAPALLLHGENDRQVPVEQGVELAAVLAARLDEDRGAGRARHAGAADVVLRRFPATDHLFLEDHDGDPRGYPRLADRRLRGDVAATISEWLRDRYGQVRTSMAESLSTRHAVRPHRAHGADARGVAIDDQRRPAVHIGVFPRGKCMRPREKRALPSEIRPFSEGKGRDHYCASNRRL